MVQVQAEEEVQGCLAQLVQQRAGAQVGLLVGRQGVGSRDLLLGLIKTPPTQEGQEPLQATGGSDAAAHASTPSGSKSGKKKNAGAAPTPSTQASSSQLTLDVDWVAEHAAQVSRMLPGGLLILGLYIFCTESGYQSVLAQLCTALTAMIAAQNIYPAGLGESVPASPLLLFADAASRKVTLRSLDVPQGATASPSHLKIADLKFAPSASSLVCLRCSHTLDMALPAPSSCDQLQHQLETLVEEACQAIRCSVAVVADSTTHNSGTSSPITIPPESAPLTDCIPPPTPPTSTPATTTNSNTNNRSGHNQQQHSSSTPSPLTQLMPSIPILPVTLFTPVGISNTVSASEGVGTGPGEVPGGSGTGKDTKDGHTRNGQSSWASLVEMVQSVGGQAGLQGAVQGVAYCHKRESFGRSVLALKADLMASLRARVDLVLEDAMASWDAQQQQQQQCHPGKGAGQTQQSGAQHPLLRSGAAALTKPVALPLPQRVLVLWPGHQLALCDYLLPGEGPEATVERAQELLAPPLPPASYPGLGDVLVLEPACPSLSAKQLTPWHPHTPSPAPHTVPATAVAPPGSQATGSFSAHTAAVRRACGGGAVVAAAGVAAVGVALGYMLYGQQ